MDIINQLVQKKSTVIKKWFDHMMATYPADTAQFLRSQKDPFANPVGHHTRKSLESIFDHLIEGFERTTAQPLIDPILRIRAIQDFTADQAVRFVFDLKTIIRKSVSLNETDAKAQIALGDMDKRIDELALLAFDVYMQCREKIYDLKANEMRQRTLSAFDRAGLIKEPDIESLS